MYTFLKMILRWTWIPKCIKSLLGLKHVKFMSFGIESKFHGLTFYESSQYNTVSYEINAK